MFIKPITATSSFLNDTLDNPVLSTIAEEEENDINFYFYANSGVEDKEHASYYMFIDSSTLVVFANITCQFNSILNSGCIIHIIKNWEFFWTYNME